MSARIILNVRSQHGNIENCEIHGLTLKESTGELEETARQLLEIAYETKFTAKIKSEKSGTFYINDY